ncbi:3'-5' exoribonuclease domain-containing protein [Actinomadura yumaensis]|uniref:3'-5' exoribonuclease domain-containing protein n=1 Tax=Actinomadura yumaensis TaxID=111807 RepID=A0ABW2CNW6_9ACTN
MPTEIFHDWEFLEDGKTIAPISVGITTSDGRDYYAVNRDLPEAAVYDHPWLRENVMPYLPHTPGPRLRHGWLDVTRPDVKPPAQIAAEVRDLITATADVELWGYYSAFDHVCLAWLYGPMMRLPAGIPMWTNDIRQETARLGLTPEDLPRQDGQEHHALADARHDKTMLAFLRRVAADQGRD